MNIKERLSFFQEMVQCEYPLHLWRYDPDFELIKTDCPAEMMLPDIISMLGFSSLVLSHRSTLWDQPLPEAAPI